MPARRKPELKEADWPAERTLRILKEQLDALQKFRGKTFREADQEEQEWKEFTLSALIHGFGEASQNVSNFYSARNAGVYNMMGISDHQRQLNFQQRIERFQATLSSSIRELLVMLPEAELKGAYEPGDEFAFYLDLKGILASAAKEVFIVDNYLNTDFFELYVAPIPAGVAVRILSDQVRGNLDAVARKYSARGNFELRSSGDVHDRHVFVDGRGWMIGQSIKDAAKKKPTYMVEIGAGALAQIRAIYEAIWTNALPIVKG
jgi:hypothetical protein